MNISTGECTNRGNKCRWHKHECPNTNDKGVLNKGTKFITISGHTGGKGFSASICIDCSQHLFEDLEHARQVMMDEVEDE